MTVDQTWNDQALKLKAAGFNDNEIENEQLSQRDKLAGAGFSEDEINAHFGTPKPDTKNMEGYVKGNLKTYGEIKKAPQSEDQAASNIPGGVPASLGIKYDKEGKEVKADSFIGAVEAGLQMSNLGLLLHGKPTTVLPEDAPTYMRIASQLSELIPDLPLMGLGGALGGIMGGAAGTAIAPGAGTVAGVTAGFGAGSFALPTALRTMMMEHYQKGDIKDFNDFWERLSAVTIASLKDGVTGAATSLIGGKVTASLAEKAIPAVQKTMGTIASEIATMVTVGKGLEGEMPKFQDFTDAALLVGGLHSIAPIKSKLMDIYSKTGLKPSQVAEHAEGDPTIKQDILASNKEVPSAYEHLVDPSLKPKEEKTDIEPTAPGTNPEFSKDQIIVKEEPVTPEPKKVEEPITPEGEKTDLQKAHEAISEKLGSKADKSNFDLAKEYLKSNFKNFYQNYVDKFDPIKKAVTELSDGKGIEAAADAYKLARIANDAPAKARYMIEYGTIDYNTLEKNGKGLKEILDPIKTMGKEELPKFQNFLVARRALELESRGINSGFDREAAKTIVESEGSRFEQAAKDITEYNNKLLKYLSDAGFLDKDTLDKLTSAHENYVPFKRLFEDESAVNKNSKKGSPIKQIKGVKSEDILTANPLESILENTVFFSKLVEKNRAISALVEQAENSKDQKVITELSQPAKPVKAKSGELLDLLKAHEIDPNSIDTVGFAKQHFDLKPNQFDVWRDGKRIIYETTPELATAIKALDGDPLPTNIAFKLAKFTASTLRLSISMTPDFIARNVFRDQLTAGVFSKSGGLTHFVDTLGSLGELMQKDKSKNYQEWLKSGGAGGTFLDLNKSYLEKDIFELSNKTGLIDRAWNLVSTPVHFLKVGAELTEQATRFAEFKKITGNDFSANKLIEGGYGAREVTVDFQRMGLKSAAFNAITAFQNVAVQGVDRTARAVKADPAGTLGRAALLITVPSVALWALNKDDPRYNDLPQWQKDLFWILPTDNWVKPDQNDDISALPDHLIRYDKNGVPEINKGHIYRFPKPQELGLIFGSAIERTLDAFHAEQADPKAAKRLVSDIAGAMIPSLIPNILTAPIETFANRSLFTGNPIVPASAEGLLPEYRFNDYTSETAKKLSHYISDVPGMKNIDAIAPAVIDNWIQSWSGNLGKVALQVADAGLRKAGVAPDDKPEKTLSDIPFVQAFIVRHPSNGTQPIQDFYDKYQEYKQSLDTVNNLKKRGDMDAAERELNKIDDLGQAQKYITAGMAMANLRRTLHRVYQNPDITPVEKRQQIDGLYYMMNETAKKTNARGETQ